VGACSANAIRILRVLRVLSHADFYINLYQAIISAVSTSPSCQYVAQDNGLGLQVQAAADESDSKHDTARQ